MAMESASASAPGAVAMEIPMRGALPVVEEDEGYSAPPPGSEERLRYRRGGGRRRRGVPFNRGGYYMLIVIGEIGTEQQLDTAKAQIERGIRSWDVDLKCCDLDQQLQLFITRHSAHFSSEVRGLFLFPTPSLSNMIAPKSQLYLLGALKLISVACCVSSIDQWLPVLLGGVEAVICTINFLTFNVFNTASLLVALNGDVNL
ncbi:Electromotor neuron-associated protein 1 [Collichthys lucidus]|uniref:Electromotor neuron-associated protein 1 n=1 Tax=Collichthys lucidus TaxID=240159 RepID=A0A4U5UGW7_COLLU|nr:Electromotor neuron-associated protein 1 [Collichthys lucidus]